MMANPKIATSSEVLALAPGGGQIVECNLQPGEINLKRKTSEIPKLHQMLVLPAFKLSISGLSVARGDN
jgi:hypothetical protein